MFRDLILFVIARHQPSSQIMKRIKVLFPQQASLLFTMKFLWIRLLFTTSILAVNVACFTVLPRSATDISSSLVVVKAVPSALDPQHQDENSRRHAQVTAAALALATLLWMTHPAPLYEASHPAPTAFPSLVMSSTTERIVPAAHGDTTSTMLLSKWQIQPTPGFGFGGLELGGPHIVAPFGAFGGGVIIRHVPDNVVVPPHILEPMTAREQHLNAIVQQQRKQLEQYERTHHLQPRPPQALMKEVDT